MELPTGRKQFPQAQEDFERDDRVSYSKLDKKWILEDDFDGSEWEFDEAVGKWIPSLDEALIEQQSKAYAVAGVNEEEDVTEEIKKRKKQAKEDNASNGPSKRQKKSKEAKERVNTAVYVTNLPADTDVEEVNHVFNKCGVIAENIDSGEPRIKLYKNDSGKLKGDALVVYFRAESVQLAMQMLDDTDFRFGIKDPRGTMRVKAADFSFKKEKEAPTERKQQDQKKITKKTQKMLNKLADWSDEEDGDSKPKLEKVSKVVILKHMFSLEELAEDPAAILEIKQDIRDECSKLGDVTNVILYDKEVDGIASVRFATAEQALACINVMHGRHFGGLQVEATLATSKERYQKSDARGPDIGLFDDDQNAEDEERERLDGFGSWLENDA